MLYFLTVAMLPAHKESVRNHPLEFGIGVLMHLGVLLALAGVLVLVVHVPTGIAVLDALSPLFLFSLAAGLFLFIRRLASRNLRHMSAPDDYLAILLTCGLLAVVTLIASHPRMPLVVLVYAALFFAYLPLGKLRHVVFFFAARADYGRRLGYRGVYPPPAKEDAR